MRLIDADALELEPDPFGGMNGCICVGRSGGKTMAIVQGMLKHMIKKAPTIDAAEVVRCKDCKHRPKENRSLDGFIYVEFPEEEICPFNCEDPFYNQMPEDDFFCARGERRSDV